MSSTNKQSQQQTVLPMRFYANWDVDRTSSPIAVQRILSMMFTRLVLSKTLVSGENTPITIAVRLQSNRRILRSNDLCIFPSRLDTPLDISFTIQYCHFIKRKQNILQILIQRRKRYKNRQIPGFKTLAMGHLNLDEILQFGGSREVVIWDTTCLNKARHSMRELHAGKIFIANCYTQAAESSDGPTISHRQRVVLASNEKEPPILSEEEPEESSGAGDDSESDIDYTPRGRAEDPTRRQKKFLNQRNIKQRVFALLRKFKPDEGASTSECPHSSRSVIVPPTEQELQEIFEELGNISDSGPELEPDKMSIISNPRPKIRPFFGSKSDIMPPIVDDYQNEEGLFLSDELSDDSEMLTSGGEDQPTITKQDENDPNRKESSKSNAPKPTNYVRPLLVHSETVNSIQSQSIVDKQRPPKLAMDPMEELLSKLEAVPPSQIIPEHVWICSSADLSWISKVNEKLLEPVTLFDCPTASNVRALLQAIIGKIQNFCNNNSISPPTTTIGVLGGDYLLANLLKAYVHLLQDKACKEDWLNYLRFSLVLPPSSPVGRLLSQVAGFGGYSEAIWKHLYRVSKHFGADAGVAEHNDIRNCLTSLTPQGQAGDQRCTTNLHIGEVMLQLSKSGPSSVGRSDPEGKLQVFVPFLAELLTGSNIGTASSSDPSFPSFNFIRQATLGEEQQQRHATTEMNAPEVPSTMAALPVASSSQTTRGYPAQHSQSSPSIPALTVGEVREKDTIHGDEEGNTSPPRQPSAKNSPSSALVSEARELQIEYWTALNYPCSSTAGSSSTHQQIAHPSRDEATTSAAGTSNVGSKFSMKASVRTLSIAREPMSNLLSILFVKERKKDKVLQKLGRRSKQKSIDTGAGFCSQSRVVSGVSRIVCTTNSSVMAKKEVAMDVSIDGVLWRAVRFFQIGAQWQTHVKLFPVTRIHLDPNTLTLL